MPRFAKTLFKIGFVLVLGWVCFFTAFSMLENRQWNDAAENPFIESIGRWGGESFDTEVEIERELLPKGISRQDWIAIMRNHDFGVQKDKKNCSWSGNDKLAWLTKYNNCAVKIIGETGCCSCSYVYIVAASFEDDILTEAIGTHSHFMCM